MLLIKSPTNSKLTNNSISYSNKNYSPSKQNCRNSKRKGTKYSTRGNNSKSMSPSIRINSNSTRQ